MLAVVKKPHTEIELHGRGADKILDFLRQRFSVEVVEDSVPVRETDWWKKNKHRILAGFRHKVGLTQKELASLSGIRQSLLSEYENDKRPMTLKTAVRLAKFLKAKPEQLLNK
jgi:DNA-binding XRE family transcriptional regulator